MGTILLSILFILAGHYIAIDSGQLFGGQDVISVRAKVLRIVDIADSSYTIDGQEDIATKTVLFEARLLSGDHKNETVSATQNIDTMFAFAPDEIQVGDVVVLEQLPDQAAAEEYYFSDFYRITPLVWLGLLFFALLILFGRKKGLDTVISLVFTFLSVFVVLLPAILNGKNIYTWSIVICIYITIMTLILVSGLQPKSLVAAIGCVGGVLASGLITVIMTRVLKMTGLLEEESTYLIHLNPDNPIDLKAIIFAMIIVGAVGAVMDVAMSIASSISELKQQSPQLSARQMLRSGLNIGRDIMGTMANTLVLAYIGSSLTCVLLLFSYNSNVLQIVNREVIVADILQAIAGSLGILLALPLTSLAAAFFYQKYPPAPLEDAQPEVLPAENQAD